MGTLHVFHGTDRVTTTDVEDPDIETDGDRFWIWVEGGSARLNFEEWQGQADAVLPSLLIDYPEMAGAIVDGASPAFDEGVPLADIASDGITVVTTADVEVLFHGTRADRLASILAEGLKGHMSPGDRMWSGSEDAEGVVHFCTDLLAAASYAHHAARSGGDPVILEIVAGELDRDAFVQDRDFAYLADRAAWTHGALSTLSEGDASLTLTGKVGHLGDVAPGAIRTIHLHVDGRWQPVDSSAVRIPNRSLRP